MDLETTDRILELLEKAYFDELESQMNYLAIATNLETFDGVDLGEKLLLDVDDELQHAKALAERISDLGGHVSGSENFNATQPYLQPPEDHTDVKSAIKGSIQAETEAIATYRELATLAQSQKDYVTYELAVQHLEDEEKHKSEMEDLLKSF